MADKELLQFVKDTKWEQYITDSTVQQLLTSLRERVTSLDSSKAEKTSSKDEESNVDLSNAARVKLVVVGDGAVGKTSLLISFSTGKFPTDYLPTVFENYTAQMKRENGLVLLHLWDTAGQEDYDRLRPLSYPGADIVLLCFSTISQASFEAIKEKWAPEINHYIPNVPKILVGTKIDLREAKHPDPNTNKYEPITTQQGESLGKEIGCARYMEVSSKTGQGLADIFNQAVDLVIGQRGGPSGSISESGKSSHSSGGGSRKKKGCTLL
jgi:Ras-related C3 botulinum toxin substrate 1